MGKLHLHLMLTEKIRRDILKNNKESYIGEGIIYKMIVADNEDPSGMVIEMDRKLRRFFQKNHKNINLAYLFGSYAKGRITPLSDVDVAVLLNDNIDPKVYFDIQTDLSDQLSSHLNREVEVVILNRADLRLSYQVIRYGKIVFEKNRNMKANFERKALNIYFDLRPMFDFYEKELLERIKEGKFGKTYRGSRNSSAEIRRIFV